MKPRTPRMWTLQPYIAGTVGAKENAALVLGTNDEPIPGQEIVLVVEAQPVAELLENIKEAFELAAVSELGPEPQREQAVDNLEAFLAALAGEDDGKR